jgi:hypothetical protein
MFVLGKKSQNRKKEIVGRRRLLVFVSFGSVNYQSELFKGSFKGLFCGFRCLKTFSNEFLQQFRHENFKNFLHIETTLKYLHHRLLFPTTHHEFQS